MWIWKIQSFSRPGPKVGEDSAEKMSKRNIQNSRRVPFEECFRPEGVGEQFLCLWCDLDGHCFSVATQRPSPFIQTYPTRALELPEHRPRLASFEGKIVLPKSGT